MSIFLRQLLLPEKVVLDLLGVAILLLAFACLGSKLFDRYITYYALQSILLSMAIALVAYHMGAWDLWALAVLTFLIRGIGIPLVTRRYLLVRLELKRDTAISTGISTSLIIGALLTGFAYFAVSPKSLSISLLSASSVPLSTAVILLGGLCMVVRHNTVAQLVGWLILENGAFLGAITLTATFPFIVEAGVFLDLVAGVLIMLTLVSGLAHLATTSASELRSLKE